MIFVSLGFIRGAGAALPRPRSRAPAAQRNRRSQDRNETRAELETRVAHGEPGSIIKLSITFYRRKKKSAAESGPDRVRPSGTDAVRLRDRPGEVDRARAGVSIRPRRAVRVSRTGCWSSEKDAAEIDF